MTNPWSTIAKPTSELNVRLVSDQHPLTLFWGVDVRGRYLFVVETATDAMPDRRSLPELAGIRLASTEADGRSRLMLLLNETQNWELFLSLCNDLVRASSAGSGDASAMAILIRRLQRWHEFLRRQRSPILPLEGIKGLIGELLFLADTLAPRFGWDAAVAFWKGPEEAPQDFAVHETAVEVKCQSGSSKPWVRISSVDQLNPQLPKAYLVVHTLASADSDDVGAFTLNGLAERVREALEGATESTRERYENLLFLAGYLPSEHYDGFVFQRIATRSFRIADGFPRLAAAGVPEGIDRITYQLSLDACAPFEAPLQL
jgi:hypothetical protein